MTFAARSIRFATLSAMVALSLLAARMTLQAIDTGASSVLVFGSTSLLFAVATGWSCLRGPRALVQIAALMIPLYILAYALTWSAEGMTAGWGNARLHQALAIEGFVIWSALLTGGVFLLRAETRAINRHVR